MGEQYEWGIWRRRPDELWRSGMTEAEARGWYLKWADDGGDPEAFWLVRRPVARWESADMAPQQAIVRQ